MSKNPLPPVEAIVFMPKKSRILGDNWPLRELLTYDFIPSLTLDSMNGVPFVPKIRPWTDSEKTQYLWDIFCRRPIKPICVEIIRTPTHSKVFIIDGQEAISLLLAFREGRYPLTFSGCPYYWHELDSRWKNQFEDFGMPVFYTEELLDIDRVEFFLSIYGSEDPAIREHRQIMTSLREEAFFFTQETEDATKEA